MPRRFRSLLSIKPKLENTPSIDADEAFADWRFATVSTNPSGSLSQWRPLHHTVGFVSVAVKNAQG